MVHVPLSRTQHTVYRMQVFIYVQVFVKQVTSYIEKTAALSVITELLY